MKAKTYTRETIRDLGVTERNFPKFGIGDTIIISQRIKEGDKERLQTFEGDIIAMRANGAASTFTIRKIGANSVSVEKIIPYYSPLLESIKFVRQGKARRAKLFYMRKRVGKAARVEEDIVSKANENKSRTKSVR
ncbi:MAG: 50S ribosomal protein L19 [Candidatus Dependentiae bacterium ADurb.Bin331]|nr:MAG: 50S ribosomal protein L19 [Candidatus Dependentiae bacterium ADurb.Bin331]